MIHSLRARLQKLSFRTGVIILLCCIPFYILSFAQMLLPLSVGTKGVLWAVFFGLAKAVQYTGVAVLGVEGYRRVKDYIRGKKTKTGKMNGIKLVIFDFDGTLGDSQRLITDTMLATIERLKLPRRSREECARTIGLPLAECFSSIISMTEEQAEECAEVYSEIFNVKNVPGAVPPFPGVSETIKALTTKNIHVSIASNRSHHSLHTLVKDMKLSEHITFLVGADDVVRRKPDTEPIEKTLDHFQVAPHETLVVGDTEFDIIMGRRAGAHTCGVSYGNGTREELEKAGAERIIDSLEELV